MLIFLDERIREKFAVLYFLGGDNFDFTRKIIDFLRWKTRENAGKFALLKFDNFDFTRKIVDF